MGSIAFWYEKDDYGTDANVSAVINFNLWTQCGSDTSFLDIGFQVTNIFDAKKLYFYIPFPCPNGIKDLSVTISKSDIISAIFNENYDVVDQSGNKLYSPVINSKNETVFLICSVDPNMNHIETSECPDGYQICINTTLIKDQTEENYYSTDFYFRFRVDIPSISRSSSIIRKYAPSNNFLQSTWVSTFLIDFRLNDIRSLPDNVKDNLKLNGRTEKKNSHFIPISKLHFLLMTKAYVDVETGTSNVSIRELEEKIWDSYVENRFNTSDIVAYHCKETTKEVAEKSSTHNSADSVLKKPIKQWEFFAKLRVTSSSWKIILSYFIFLSIMTIWLNYLSDKLITFCKADNLLPWLSNWMCSLVVTVLLVVFAIVINQWQVKLFGKRRKKST